MGNRHLKILQISTGDSMGGAEKMAWDLFQAYRAGGHASWLAVGYKTGNDPDVLAIPDRQPGGLWRYFWTRVHWRLEAQTRKHALPGLSWLCEVVDFMARPFKRMDELLGRIDFRFPGTWKILGLVPEAPDIIHCHNLHNWYFDLRALPWLSQRRPIILSLHDAWLLSGLCDHSFDCERWKTGCGACPYLSIWQPPAISTRDGTAANWKRKKAIYARSRVRVTTACRWLMDRVDQSILAPAVVEKRIIPYGVDLTRFRPPEDKYALREELGLPNDAFVLFFVARGLEKNLSKDYLTLRAGVDLAGRQHPRRKLVLVCRGKGGATERCANIEVRFQPWRNDWTEVIKYYQACDAYLHAAKVDTFPLSVLESLACGTPVVATAVAGIPEQIKGLKDLTGHAEAGPGYDRNEATGVLVPSGGTAEMAAAIERLLTDPALLRQLSANARQDAQTRFGLDRQVDRYLEWYRELRP
jgi:glycosyltransferase involved in cell wall biosynthesis